MARQDGLCPLDGCKTCFSAAIPNSTQQTLADAIGAAARGSQLIATPAGEHVEKPSHRDSESLARVAARNTRRSTRIRREHQERSRC